MNVSLIDGHIDGEKKQVKKYELYRQERNKGLTFQEIADKYGVSRQYVAQACAGCCHVRFMPIDEKRCIYPNVRKWMNDNRVSVAELTRRICIKNCSEPQIKVGKYLRGYYNPRKSTIDNLLAITGLTYEEFFEREGAE